MTFHSKKLQLFYLTLNNIDPDIVNVDVLTVYCVPPLICPAHSTLHPLLSKSKYLALSFVEENFTSIFNFKLKHCLMRYFGNEIFISQSVLENFLNFLHFKIR